MGMNQISKKMTGAYNTHDVDINMSISNKMGTKPVLDLSNDMVSKNSPVRNDLSSDTRDEYSVVKNDVSNNFQGHTPNLGDQKLKGLVIKSGSGFNKKRYLG